MSHASWLESLVKPDFLKTQANLLTEMILKDKDKLNLEAIAITGISGIIGAIVSYSTGLPLIIVRQHRGEHSSLMIESCDDLTNNFNYCIVDDLISSGKTIQKIFTDIKKEVSKGANLKKVYLYKNNSSMNENSVTITGSRGGIIRIPVATTSEYNFFENTIKEWITFENTIKEWITNGI